MDVPIRNRTLGAQHVTWHITGWPALTVCKILCLVGIKPRAPSLRPVTLLAQLVQLSANPVPARNWSSGSQSHYRLSCCSSLQKLSFIHSFIHSSMALQPFVEPWPLLRFRNLFYTDGTTPWTSDLPIARPIPTHRTHKENKCAHRHACLKWDSSPWSQYLSKQRQFMPLIARPLWLAQKLSIR
jgi:hypothetical protein